MKLAENEDYRQDIVERTKIRKEEHEVFVSKVAETEEAVAVVEECLTILNEFLEEGPSFA